MPGPHRQPRSLKLFRYSLSAAAVDTHLLEYGRYGGLAVSLTVYLFGHSGPLFVVWGFWCVFKSERGMNLCVISCAKEKVFDFFQL